VSETTILAQVALGYSPMIDPKRNVIATRLTLFPLRPDAQLDVGQLLEAVGQVWPAGGGDASLNVLSESLLHSLLNSKPTANLMIEVPSFMAVDTSHTEAIRALHANGNKLLLKGRPLSELPREVLPCFKYSIIDVDEDRRIAGTAAPAGVTRSITHVQAGVRTMEQLDAAFQRGAVAVLGWPIDDAISVSQSQSGGKASQPDLQVIMELMRRVDAEEPIEKLDQTLRRDPTLAFKLMRYINSPAFGLRVEINSFSHAIMMLGYKKLKRWLALLLATAGKDANMRPVMFAAVRRGLLMEELARGTGDEEMRNELFICGVFSLLDKLMGEPFDVLLKSIPVPERVYQALAEETGPFWPYCELIRAVEAESLFEIRDAAERLLMGQAEMNRALLKALAGASHLD
jgi:EAL and modified HD-GYP domain-containing signal transduction protein